MSRHPQAGLTVIEMVVALGIVAMTMALGTQALLQWSKAQERFDVSERRGREALLGEDWVRGALRGRLSRADEDINGVPIDVVEGDAQSISFVTLSPLGQRRGVPTRQSFRLERDAEGPVLRVEDGPTLRLRDGAAAGFVYVDAKGEAHRRWPPRRAQADEFPALVGLTSGSGLWLEAAILRPVTVPYERPPE